MADIFEFPQKLACKRFDWSQYPGVPEHTRGAIERYVFDRLEPGGFLTAVLCNNLMGAVGRADSENILALKDICQFIYNEVPSVAWGSEKNIAKWLDNRA